MESLMRINYVITTLYVLDNYLQAYKSIIYFFIVYLRENCFLNDLKIFDLYNNLIEKNNTKKLPNNN